MARILVIEDENDLRDVLAYNLKGAGHEVLVARDGKTGLELARDKQPDLLLLDLMLPDTSGLDVARAVRAEEATRGMRIVMLTAKGEEIDRVVGFELGADDYITKPFSNRELLLRISAVLRRREEPTASASAAPVKFGLLTMDREAHRVWVEGEEVTLTALEFRLLGTLYDRRNRVQTRGALLDEVWGANEDLATRTVDTHVKRLREKLGAAGDYIETVRGVGYRFVADADASDGD
jgi:two-component system phosphate regulon response regulator PhoB